MILRKGTRCMFNLSRNILKYGNARKCSTEEKLVRIIDENGMRKIVLSSPKTRNALSMEMMNELLSAVKDIHNNNETRCIEISAEGPVFSSGHNLKDLASGTENLYLDTFSKCADLMLSIIEAPVPVIAKVNGIAAAAGCQLVASCDIAIATRKSTFSTPGANFGIFCSTPGIALSRCVGRKAAARMLLTGLSVNAEEALQIGLISKVCDESQLDEEVQLHVNAIKSKSRAVIQLGKKFFYEHVEKDIRSAYKLGSKVMTYNLTLIDGQEGLKSFVEKRHPVWKNDFSKSEKFIKNKRNKRI